MSTELNNYLQDGANKQARAVLCMVQGFETEGDARPYVARWENCREQGYIISLRAENGKQFNIAFFEHRNSDSIHAIKWQQKETNSITIDNLDHPAYMADKYATDKSVGWGQITEMATWIENELEAFWSANLKP